MTLADQNVPIEKLLDKTNSVYKLVMLAAKRALELNEGAAKLTEAKTDKVILLALQEIAEGKVYCKLKAQKA